VGRGGGLTCVRRLSQGALLVLRMVGMVGQGRVGRAAVDETLLSDLVLTPGRRRLLDRRHQGQGRDLGVEGGQGARRVGAALMDESVHWASAPAPAAPGPVGTVVAAPTLAAVPVDRGLELRRRRQPLLLALVRVQVLHVSASKVNRQ
jgi:hypothetical protein